MNRHLWNLGPKWVFMAPSVQIKLTAALVDFTTGYRALRRDLYILLKFLKIPNLSFSSSHPTSIWRPHRGTLCSTRIRSCLMHSLQPCLAASSSRFSCCLKKQPSEASLTRFGYGYSHLPLLAGWFACGRCRLMMIGWLIFLMRSNFIRIPNNKVDVIG